MSSKHARLHDETHGNKKDGSRVEDWTLSLLGPSERMTQLSLPVPSL